MKTPLLSFIALSLFAGNLAHAQIVENSVNFNVSPEVLRDGNIQVAYEWLTPNEFRKRDMIVTDTNKVSELHPNNIQMVVSKIAFISKSKFDDLAYSNMSQTAFVGRMMNAISTVKKSEGLWRLTNKVKAYGLPFKVSFDLSLKELGATAVGGAARYLKDEASAFKESGRERFQVIELTNFTQLMYKNYSVSYMKEISPSETLVVSVVIAGIDLAKANSYFNFPPVSQTDKAMMRNFKTQVLHMAREVQ